MKRLIPIISFILLTATYSQAQSRNNPSQEVAEKMTKIFPNPATSVITFDLQKGYERGLTLQVYNFLGKPVYEIQNVAAKITLDLANYVRGVYIFQIRDVSGKIIESGKFQVSK